jgi:hypothetical protein
MERKSSVPFGLALDGSQHRSGGDADGFESRRADHDPVVAHSKPPDILHSSTDREIMAEIQQAPELVDGDVAAMFDAVEGVAGDGLRAFVEYDTETYNPVYIGPMVVEEYGENGDVTEFAETIHSYVKLDFSEREMYRDLYDRGTDGMGFATFLEGSIVVRYVFAETALYVSLQSSASPNEVIRAIEAVLRDDD